jgi:hypothetical protein
MMKKELIMNKNDINWSDKSVNPDISKMTSADMTQYLLHTAEVPEASRINYAAGYFESTLLTLMERFPEVRKEIEWRVNYRMNEIEVKEYNERADARRATMEVA